MIQHILLTLRYRVDNYESMNGLFAQLKENTLRQRLDQRLWGLFVELLQVILVIFPEIDEQELLERIFNDEQVCSQISILLNSHCCKMENIKQ